MARIFLACDATSVLSESSKLNASVSCCVLADLSSDLSRTAVLPLQACPALLLMLRPRAWHLLPLPPLRLPQLFFQPPRRALGCTAMH
jgi:hypothetical protein